MSRENPRIVWDLGAELGEGPVWDGRDKALWFTDIKERKVHRLDPSSGARTSWTSPEQIGFVLPAEGGGFVAGLQSGLHHFDPESGAFELLHEVEPELPSNRLNDAATDSKGRLWFGTMDDGEERASGAFYRFDRGRLTPTGIDGIPITNGPALSPDGAILYFVDTLGRTIAAADVREDGTLRRPRPFVSFAAEDGNPDGPVVDSEGCVWIGLYGGWEARRYSPEGALLERIRFPVANITKLAFGGEDLRTVYATTARQFLTPEELEKQPEAGNLFSFRADVPGLPVSEVKF